MKNVLRLGGVVGALMMCWACAGEQTMRVSKVYVVASVGDAPAVMYLTVENRTTVADTLTSVRTSAAPNAELHQDMTAMHHMTMMAPVERVVIGAGKTVRFAPGGYHVMLVHPLALRRGDAVPVTLRFRRAGDVRVNGVVIAYADVDSAVTRHE